ncbi:MAG: hypothetical protein QNI90_11660 [Dinoroseobacter sp.]|nr:hypothetical protein [Dinoroseobacter sp.]
MTEIFSSLREVVRKRIAYEQTYSELSRMPRSVARDVNLDPREARKNAHIAVYGY